MSGFGLFNNVPLKYTGVPFSITPFIARPFPPTQNDWQNFSLGCIWLNQNTQAVYILVSLSGNQAKWVQFISGSGDVQTLTSNTGGAVPPTAGNINVVGDNTTITGAGNPGTSTITLSVTGPAANGEVLISSSTLPPAWSTLTAGTGISITNGSNSITISATGTTTLNYTNVTHAQSPYTVLSTDEYISVDCSLGVVTLDFPNAATLSRAYIVKDRTGNASVNNITITTPGGTVTFDGVTSFVLNTNYESVNLLGNSTTYEVY